MRALSVLAFAILISFSAQAQEKYKLEKSNVRFFSETPMENIEATTEKTVAIIDAQKKEFAFKIQIRSFHFEKELMEEHFNENYMESEKFPNATFSGKIIGNFSMKVDGVYPVTAQGELNVHGVKKVRKIPATITVKNGKATLNSNFTIKLVDHKITIPSIMMMKIAEEIAVTIKGDLISVANNNTATR